MSAKRGAMMQLIPKSSSAQGACSRLDGAAIEIVERDEDPRRIPREPLFDEAGGCVAAQTEASLAAMTDQVLDFARMRRAA